MSAYPQEWEKHETLRDGMGVLLRPLKPDDAALYPDFSIHITPEDARLRFFHPVSEPTPMARNRSFIPVTLQMTNQAITPMMPATTAPRIPMKRLGSLGG